MQGIATETVGESFSESLLQDARDQTFKVIQATAQRITPGMTETQAKTILAQIQTELGAPKSWHPPQIRFGKNTLLPFGKPSDPNVTLQENDIFFLDIGPIFKDHEGDVGRPFTVGQNSEFTKCCSDTEKIWNEVRDHWRTHRVEGAELYIFAQTRADSYGWVLSLEKANGHRIADFPHAARARGSIEAFDQHPAANRWILEIQIRHPTKAFGAFFEDLLN